MQYELSFLTPNLGIEEKKNLFDKIEEEIKKIGGEIGETFVEKKIFAYPVKKESRGFLSVITFSAERDKIKEFYNFLSANEKILRIMIEKKEKQKDTSKPIRKREKPLLTEKPKKEKVKIEELDKKLDEILK